MKAIRFLPPAVLLMLAGIILGPSVLGSYLGTRQLLAVSTLEGVTLLGILKFTGTVGLIAFIFAMGTHFHLGDVVKELKCHKFRSVAFGSIVWPSPKDAARCTTFCSSRILPGHE